MTKKKIISFFCLILLIAFSSLVVAAPNPYDCTTNNLNADHCFNFEDSFDDEIGTSQGNSTGTVFNSTFTQDGFSKNIHANSLGDEVTIDDVNVDVIGNWTICGWFNLVDGTSTKRALDIRGSPTTKFFDFEMDGGASGDDIAIHLEDGSCGVRTDFAEVSLTNTGWNHYCIVRNGTEFQNTALYINGTFQEITGSGQSCPLSSAALDSTFTMFEDNAGGRNTIGNWDNFIIWQSDALNRSEVLDVFNPTVEEVTIVSLNITDSLPANLTQYNTNLLNFNITVNASYNFNASLYINGTLNQTKEVTGFASNIFVDFNLSFDANTEKTFTYFIDVEDNTTHKNTTIKTFFVDTVSPSFVGSTFNNNFAAYTDVLVGQINFSDDFQIFSYDVFIDDVPFLSNESLNYTTYSLNLTLDISNVSAGQSHTLTINVSDGHTANYIPEYDYSRNVFTKSLTYRFGKGDVKIYPQDAGLFDSFNTNKLFDRYQFTHKRSSPNPTQVYFVESDEKISVIQNNKYKGWLVINKLKKWIDFENNHPNSEVSVQQLTDYKVKVTVSNLGYGDITFNSIGDLNTISQSYTFFKGEVNTSLTTPISSTETTTYKAIFSYNSSFITDINSSVFWNGTLLGYDTKTVGTHNITFIKEFTLPNKDSSTVNVYWNYTITGVNNTERNLTSNQTQSIINIDIINCSSANENVSLTFFPRDEVTNNIISNVSVDATFEIYINQENVTKINQSFEFRNGDNYSICTQPRNQTFLVDSFITYEKSLFSQRNYFLTKAQIRGNNTKSVNLYLINDSLDSDVEITVTNENDDPLTDHFVKVLRYFPGNNSFKTVEIARTGENGDTVARLILNDVFYKFIVADSNKTVFTSTNSKVLGTQLFLTVTGGSDFLQTLEKIENLEYSFTYNNNSGVYTFTFSDSENIIREALLRVTKKSPGGDETLCENSVESSSGTLTCSINTSIESLYIAQAYIDTTTRNSLSLIDIIETNLVKDFERFGTIGLILQIFMINIMVGLGMWRPSAALIFGALTVITGSAMGLVGIGYSSVIAIIALIVLIIGLVKD